MPFSANSTRSPASKLPRLAPAKLQEPRANSSLVSEVAHHENRMVQTTELGYWELFRGAHQATLGGKLSEGASRVLQRPEWRKPESTTIQTLQPRLRANANSVRVRLESNVQHAVRTSRLA